MFEKTVDFVNILKDVKKIQDASTKNSLRLLVFFFGRPSGFFETYWSF
jgi:hypothetical protein